MIPWVFYKAGDQCKTVRGESRPVPRKTTSFWTSELKSPDGTGIADAIRSHLPFIGIHATFLKDFVATGGTVEFFVGWFMERSAGEVLDCDLMQELARLQISLGLNVYGPGMRVDNQPG